MPQDPIKTEAQHNREMEAFQKQLDREAARDNNERRADVISSGHTMVADTVTFRALRAPNLDELDGTPDE